MTVGEQCRADTTHAEKNGLEEADARARIESQLSNEERIGKAGYVIENNGTLEALQTAVESSWNQLQERLRHAAGR